MIKRGLPLTCALVLSMTACAGTQSADLPPETTESSETAETAQSEMPSDDHTCASGIGAPAGDTQVPTSTAPLTEQVYDPDGPGPASAQIPVEGFYAPGPSLDAPTNPPAGTVLTYDPSGAQSGNTYTVFADLVAAAATVKGGGTIFIPNDTTIDAPGEYDLNYFGFASNGSTRGFSRTILTIPDGVSFTNPGYILAQGALVLYSTSNSSVVTVEATNAETSRMFILENDGFVASRSAAFFTLSAATDTSYIFISMRHGGGLAKPSDLGIPGGDHESLLANAGAGFIVLTDAAAPLGFHDATVRGDGTVVWNRYTTALPSQGISVDRGRYQPNASAFVEILLGTTALSHHDQSVPEHWNLPDCSSTAASLDELAARIHALEHP